MSEPVHDPRGSSWRRWDLHFHTPSSYDIKNDSMSNEDVVKTLVDEGVSVVAITDHHFMDVDRIRELQELAGDDLAVLPGIEVSTELGGKRSVHLTAVFSEDCDLVETWKTLEVEHGLSVRKVQEVGDEAVFVDCADFSATVHGLGGIVIAHAGTKCNSIEEIGNSTAFKQAMKTGLARDSIDIFEIASRDNVGTYRDIVFPKIKKDLPLILCSDSHSIADYSPPPCWINADPGFLGLRQVLEDPWRRVDLSDYPVALRRVEQNATRYLAEIKYARVDGSNLDEKWFDDVHIPLNPGLTAIIGNKGSGKSALTETIGLVGGCRQSDHFSFLHRDRFLKGRSADKSKAAHFETTVTWADGDTDTMGLADTNADVGERVKYIPQHYLESICNELQSTEGGEFRVQLEQVVVSHVPEEDRNGHQSIGSLISYRTSELQEAIALKRTKLGEINLGIENTEERILPANREQLEGLLELKKAEIKALDEAKPTEVLKPADDPDADPELKAKAEKAEAIEAELKGLEKKVKVNLAAQGVEKRASVSALKLLQSVKNFEESYNSLQLLWDEEAESAGVELSAVVTHVVDTDPLTQRIADANAALANLEQDMNPDIEGTLEFRRVEKAEELAQIRKELSAPQRAYDKYRDELSEWETKRESLVGSESAPESLRGLEAQIEQLKELPDRLKDLKADRAKTVREVFADLEAWRDEYRKLYRPVQDYIERHPLASAVSLKFV